MTCGARGSKLVIGGSKTTWVWRDDSGAVTGFGDPMSGETEYHLCMGSGPNISGGFQTKPGFEESWHPIGGGFRYKETTNLTRSVLLRARSGRAAVKAKVGASYSPLPATNPITMRIVEVAPAPSCLEMTYSNPTVNDPERYKARE